MFIWDSVSRSEYVHFSWGEKTRGVDGIFSVSRDWYLRDLNLYY